MITADADLFIGRPIEEVFAFLTDVTNHPRWDTSSIEMVPLQPGPWRKGLEFHEVRRIGPRITEVRSRIAGFEPDRSMDLESLTGPSFRGHWRLSAADGGTRLRWTGELQPTGVMRFIAPLIERQFRRATATNFERLQQLLEGGAEST
jgi:uncharacterized membrane protein